MTDKPLGERVAALETKMDNLDREINAPNDGIRARLHKHANLLTVLDGSVELGDETMDKLDTRVKGLEATVAEIRLKLVVIIGIGSFVLQKGLEVLWSKGAMLVGR